MPRRLDSEELALWARVAATVRPLGSAKPVVLVAQEASAGNQIRSGVRTVASARTASVPNALPSNTLDGSWDRRLAHGLVRPDVVIDLHGHSLAAAHARLDSRLGNAIADGARVVLLITGKPPRDDRRPIARGAIRASVGDWLLASRHSAAIAAVRPAHRRHGGAGALYVILRKALAGISG